jgi:hypothetical protein
MYYFYYSKKRLIFWDDHEVVSASCDNDVACVFRLSILECPSVFSNVCLSRLVRPMLPVSLDCQVVKINASNIHIHDLMTSSDLIQEFQLKVGARVTQ